jgi:hypothetical protein
LYRRIPLEFYGDVNMLSLKVYSTIIVVLICCHVEFCRASLVHVHVLYRHGDRSPIHIFPKSEHQKDSWSMGLGQLTTRGMRQHFALGGLFRQLYGDDFLSDSYQITEIRVRSTDYERTLMSSYCNLAGLYYPRKDDQRWNSSIPWVPVPVHTIPTAQDIMLIDSYCPRYDQLEDELLQSPMVQLVVEENRDLFELLQQETGLPPPVNISNMWQIQDQLYCEEQHNLSKPTWFTDTVRRRLYELNDFGWRLKYYENELCRLRAGVLLQTILEHMQDVVNGTERDSGNKMIVYSGHDTDVAAALAALGIYNGKQPPYASAVLLELHQDDISREWFVRTFLHNSSVNENFEPGPPYQLTLPHCQDDCPFGNFTVFTEPSRMSRKDYEKACEPHSAILKQTFDTRNVVTFCVIILCLMGLAAMLVLVAFFLCRQKRMMNSYDSRKGYSVLPKELHEDLSEEESNGSSSYRGHSGAPFLDKP